MPVFQRLTAQPMNPLRSQKRLPTRPFLVECFCILRSLSDFLFTHEVFGFLFQSSFHVFRLVARAVGDPIDTIQQVALMQQMQTQHRPRRCFPPALSASTA